MGRRINFKNKKKFFLLIGSFLVCLSALTSQAAVLSPELQSALSSLGDEGNEDEISVIVTLSDKPNIHIIKDQDRRLRRSKIIRHLKDKADRSQKASQTFLEGQKGEEDQISLVDQWISRYGIAADVIRQLAAFTGVESIRLDATIQAPEVTYETSTLSEWNLNAIGAPELWSLGYTGQGVVIASVDTGVDVDHPDLNSRWRGGDNSWYDPNGEHATPYDANGHGTQTMGIMVGGNARGTAIGVAPDAKWIAVKIFDDGGTSSLSVIHQGFQWLLDPDDDPDTDDAPDIVNNSWWVGDTEGNCFPEFQNDVDTLRSAGIALVFAAGNSGPGSQTSVSPANNTNAFPVGAIDSSNNIASFSSRGPSACGGSTYPIMVAPGVSVRTSDLTFGGVFPNSYAVVSGTSFSAPHISGAMALLLSAFPNLSLSKLEWSLRSSAIDLGKSGPDNTYGHGMVDVVQAYHHVVNSLQADFDGDGKNDMAVYRTATGSWFVYPSGGGAIYGVGFGGDPSDRPVPGDYDGDGKTDIAIYRSGSWFILPSSTGVAYGIGFGGDASDKPVPADYDGDGKTDIAIYRSGSWFILPSSTGVAYGIGFGGDASDKPVPADYDGDGKTDIAIYRSGSWFILPSSTGVAYGIGFGGDASDKPVPADYDGDGKTDIAIYRSGSWFILPSSTGTPYGIGFGGDPSDKPVPADYDGDGKTDIAIYRSGSWFIYPSSSGPSGIYGVGFGGDLTDLPVVINPAAYM
jgi:subtilisin family serine protease